MNVSVNKIGSRDFLVLEGVGAIPIDTIKYIDFKAPNGGSTNCVHFITLSDRKLKSLQQL